MKHRKEVTEKQVKADEIFVKAMWFALIGFIILAMCLGGCRTSKGCGDYAKWESKVKFRSK
jgi:hypothetical protein